MAAFDDVSGLPPAMPATSPISPDELPGVARTGMGWWYPEAPGPERGALEININAAMRYDGPWDPMTGSADTRGLSCRITKTNAAAAAE